MSSAVKIYFHLLRNTREQWRENLCCQLVSASLWELKHLTFPVIIQTFSTVISECSLQYSSHRSLPLLTFSQSCSLACPAQLANVARQPLLLCK